MLGIGGCGFDIGCLHNLRFAASTLLDFSNSLSMIMLNGYYFSVKYHCIVH